MKKIILNNKLYFLERNKKDFVLGDMFYYSVYMLGEHLEDVQVVDNETIKDEINGVKDGFYLFVDKIVKTTDKELLRESLEVKESLNF